MTRPNIFSFLKKHPSWTLFRKGKQNKSSKFKLIDLPGTYSLSAYSFEEQVTINWVLNENDANGNGVVGEIGEDVTEQVKTIRTVPLTIPYKGLLIIHGEGIIKLSELEKYNKTTDEKLKNARNAVAGAIRNLDPKVTAKRKLDFFA